MLALSPLANAKIVQLEAMPAEAFIDRHFPGALDPGPVKGPFVMLIKKVRLTMVTRICLCLRWAAARNGLISTCTVEYESGYGGRPERPALEQGCVSGAIGDFDLSRNCATGAVSADQGLPGAIAALVFPSLAARGGQRRREKLRQRRKPPIAAVRHF